MIVVADLLVVVPRGTKVRYVEADVDQVFVAAIDIFKAVEFSPAFSAAGISSLLGLPIFDAKEEVEEVGEEVAPEKAILEGISSKTSGFKLDGVRTKLGVGLEDEVQVELDWKITWSETLQEYYLHIINGVTGYESAPLFNVLSDALDMGNRDGFWNACAGTRLRWDKLVVTGVSLRELSRVLVDEGVSKSWLDKKLELQRLEY